MYRSSRSIDIQFFDRNALVDLLLLFALANVALGFAEAFSNMEQSLNLPLRLALTTAIAVAIHRFGTARLGSNADTATQSGPIVEHDEDGVLDRQTFFSFLERSLRSDANGFVLLIHANDIEDIDERYGIQVGDFFLSSLLSRVTPSIVDSDLVGRLERETFAVFLKDRTLDEVRLVGRRMSGNTLIPLQDSAERAHLSACVGYTEIIPGEQILAPLERANQALAAAQLSEENRHEMWTAKLSKIEA